MDNIMHKNALNLQGNLQSLENPRSQWHAPPIRSPSAPSKRQKRSTSPNNHSHDEIDHGDNGNVDYRSELSRRESFKNWPLTNVDPVKLASAGFYYTGEANVVKCFECNVDISQWAEGDNPMSDHQRWRSSCRFVRRIPCGNIPFGIDPTTLPASASRGRDVCGLYDDGFQPLASPDFKTKPMGFPSSSTTKRGSMGLSITKRPNYPEYASYDARLRTFQSWPISMVQTKEELADAGFYYTGRGDQTVCYDCGIGLMHWEPQDNPWEQHVRAREKCRFALTVKGREYINSVIDQKLSTAITEKTIDMDSLNLCQEIDQTTSQEEEEENKSPQAIASTSKSSPDIDESPEGKDVDDPRMCKICCKEERAIVFLPCGHIVACAKCAPGMAICAICQECVTVTVHAIIS